MARSMREVARGQDAQGIKLPRHGHGVVELQLRSGLGVVGTTPIIGTTPIVVVESDLCLGVDHQQRIPRTPIVSVSSHETGVADGLVLQKGLASRRRAVQ